KGSPILNTWSLASKLVLLSVLSALPFACSDDDGEDDDDTSAVPQTVEVCGEEIECGGECVSDSACPDGQHCSNENECYAECTESTGCNGTCSAAGRCNGT